jgi:pSer/pThr/pTyr-binding forkhead associated (FHA) protein
MIYIILGGIVLLNIVFIFLMMKNKNRNTNSTVPVTPAAEEVAIEKPNDFVDEYVKTQALGSTSSPSPIPEDKKPVKQDKTEVLKGGISNLSESEKQSIRAQSTVGETVVLSNQSIAEPKTYLRNIQYQDNNEERKFKWDESTPLTIGRDPNSSDLTVSSDNFIGRKHALLYKKDNHYYLVDLDSKNGTFVHNEPLKGQTEIAIDQVFRLGQTEFILK